MLSPCMAAWGGSNNQGKGAGHAHARGGHTISPCLAAWGGSSHQEGRRGMRMLARAACSAQQPLFAATALFTPAPGEHGHGWQLVYESSWARGEAGTWSIKPAGQKHAWAALGGSATAASFCSNIFPMTPPAARGPDPQPPPRTGAWAQSCGPPRRPTPQKAFPSKA
jgi:hypothetical protein